MSGARRRLFRLGRSGALVALAAAIYGLAVLAFAAADRRAARDTFADGSTWNTGDDGASLAYAYLGGRHRVRTLVQPLDGAELPQDAVVFRLQPTVVPNLPRQEVRGKGGKGIQRDNGPKKGREAKGAKADDEDEEAGASSGDDLDLGDLLPGRKGKEKDDKKAKERERRRRRSLSDLFPTPPPLLRGVPLLTVEEEAWVRGGGRLVIGVTARYGPLTVEELRGVRAEGLKVFPLWPGVARLLPPTPRELAGRPLALTQTLFVAGDRPLVARTALGRGDLILLACPEVLYNRHLAAGDHLALLGALAGDGGAARPVYFDEHAHGAGQGAGTLSILGRWGLGPFLLLLLLAGAAAFFRAVVRTGPADRDDPDRRSDAVELVDSLADLYGRALGRGDAIRLYYESFVRAEAIASGLKGAALIDRVRARLPGFTPPGEGERDLPRPAFDRALAALNEATAKTRADHNPSRRQR